MPQTAQGGDPHPYTIWGANGEKLSVGGAVPPDANASNQEPLFGWLTNTEGARERMLLGVAVAALGMTFVIPAEVGIIHNRFVWPGWAVVGGGSLLAAVSLAVSLAIFMQRALRSQGAIKGLLLGLLILAAAVGSLTLFGPAPRGIDHPPLACGETEVVRLILLDVSQSAERPQHADRGETLRTELTPDDTRCTETGIITFGHTAQAVCADDDCLLPRGDERLTSLVDALTTDTRGGSDLAAGLRMSAELLDASTAGGKTLEIALFTDGIACDPRTYRTTSDESYRQEIVDVIEGFGGAIRIDVYLVDPSRSGGPCNDFVDTELMRFIADETGGEFRAPGG